MNRVGRAAVYSIVGFAAEVVFSALHDKARGRHVHFRTSAWMLPIYALIQPLFEPLHDTLQDRPVAVRAASYSVGFLSVEYASGWVLRGVTGRAAWDHSEARWHVDGLIRPDYALYWAAAGLALEPLHARLVLGSGGISPACPT